MSEPTIRVISLPGSDRRPTAAREMAALARAWSFFDAIDRQPPPGIPYDPARARRRFGRELDAAELGIFSSHVALWREAAAADPPAIWLIFEDDVRLEPHFARRLLDILDWMQRRQIGFLRLFAMTDGPRIVETRLPSVDVYRYLGDCWGGQAYLLTSAGARRLLAAITRVERPIDNELDRYWHHGLADRVTVPFLVRHDTGSSTIEPGRAGMERDRRASRQWRRGLHHRQRLVMWWHGSLTRLALVLRRR